MDKKPIHITIFALLALAGYLPLMPLVSSFLTVFFPWNSVTYAATYVIALGLSCLFMWLLFTKWKTKFWIKAATAGSVIVIGLVVIRLIAITTASNITHTQ